MTDTTFSQGTVISSDWLNAINDFFYTLFAGSVTATQARTALGLATVAYTDVAQHFTKPQYGDYVSLTSTSNSTAINLASSANFKTTLTENTTLAAPTNVIAGQSGVIEITQHASSAKTFAYNSFWKWAAATPGVISATIGSKNILCYITDSTGTFATCTLQIGVA